MRIFAHSYGGLDNLATTFNLGVFGAPDDGTHLGTKVATLSIGDLLLIRFSNVAELRFAPLCRIARRIFDQRQESPFRDYLWPDEQTKSKILYPFRCAIERLTEPRIRQNDVQWSELDALGLRNQKGDLLLGRQMWGVKLRGNLFVDDDAVRLLAVLSPPA
jgi:hypothetical protein